MAWLTLCVLTLTPMSLARRAARRREAAQDAHQTALAEWFTALSLELRTGVVPARALLAVAPWAPSGELASAAAMARGARDPGPALAASPDLLVRTLASLWRMSGDSGAPLAESVVRLATTCRQRLHAQRALRAALAGPMASAHILAVLPLLGLGLGEAMGVAPTRVLLRSIAGLACLVVGSGFAAAGIAWTSLLVRRAEREISFR